MAPSPWAPEAKSDWMCKFCTFRRTGLPLINYGSNEKCFKCKVHKGQSFKCVVPVDSPSRSTKRKPPPIGGESSALAKLEKRLQSLEAENQRLRAPQDGGQQSQAQASDLVSEELRDEIDGLVKHVQWLESVKLPWAAQPLQAARDQLEASRRKLYENKPLPAKLTALSRRAEQARQRLQKAEAHKLEADKALAAAQSQVDSAIQALEERKKAVEDLDEELRQLSSQPGQAPMAVDLTGPEIYLSESKLVECLGSMDGVADASKLAPMLVEALKSRAAELFSQPPEKKQKTQEAGVAPPTPGRAEPDKPAEWNHQDMDVEALRKDVADFVEASVEEAILREKAKQLAAGLSAHACKYGGATFPDYSELKLCEYRQQDIETESTVAPSSTGVVGDSSSSPWSQPSSSSAQDAAQALRWAADFEAPSSNQHQTEFTLVTYNGNTWTTVQTFLEWLVFDKYLQPDVLHVQEHRLRGGDQLKSAQSWSHARGYRFLANGCQITGSTATSTSSGVGVLSLNSLPSVPYVPHGEYAKSRMFFQRTVIGSMQILLASVYGITSVGQSGNLELFASLIQVLRESCLPFIVAGDWNVESECFGRDTFLRAGFLGHLHAEIVHGGRPTCNESHYDYYIVSDILLPFIRSVGVIDDTPVGPHRAVVL
ncbi:unnamed protein product, partial [Prorocentrum cordatum]